MIYDNYKKQNKAGIIVTDPKYINDFYTLKTSGAAGIPLHSPPV